MRKILLLLVTLLLVGASWTEVGARYNLGDRKAYDQISAGDTVAIQGISDNANNGYRYIASGVLQTTFTEECVYVVEDGPADIRTGGATYFFRQVVSDKYLGLNALRGEAIPSSSATRMVATPDSAYNFAICCAQDSSQAWNGQQNFDATSVALCYSYADGDGNNSYAFLCNWGWYDADAIHIWSYKDTNPWDIYQVYETADAQGELDDLLNLYTTLDLNFTAGSDPGYYPSDLVDAYKSALEEAQRIVVTPNLTQEEYKQAADNLKAAKEAVEKAYIEITEGYYYVVCAYTNFMSTQNVEKGCFVTADNSYIQWKDLDTKDAAFIFYITPLANGNFTVRSYNTDSYWDSSTSDASSLGIEVSATQDHEQIFSSIGDGQWQIWNTLSTRHYHPESNAGGSGKSGKLVTWSTSGKGSASTWYVRAINDLTLIDSLDKVKAQAKLTAELSELVIDANTAYDKLFVYTGDQTQPLITNVVDGDAENCQLSSNASDPSEGLYFSYLIDGDATTFWHSTWHSSNDPGTYHYLQADFSNSPQTSVQIYFRRREGSNGQNDRPATVNIYVTADTTGQYNNTANWTLIKTLYPTTTSSVYDYYSTGIEFGMEAKYLRFEVTEKVYPSRNLNGYPYFNLAEFQLYPVTLNEELSQYNYVDGMKAAADSLSDLVDAAEEMVEANTATQEAIDALTAALSRVNSLYADTTQLTSILSTCQTLADGLVVGTKIGQAPNQDVIDTFRAAIEANTLTGLESTQLNREAIVAAYNALREARITVLNSLNLPQEDEWYYLTNLDTTRTGDLYTNGGVMYAPTNGADVEILWALNESDSLTYNANAMWHFVAVEDEGYPLTYYIQNLGTGLYIGDYSTYSVPITTSETPVLYQLNIAGGQVGLIARRGENPGYTLHATNPTSGANIVGWTAGANTPSAWDIVAVDRESVDAITINTTTNFIDVFSVPYEFSDLGIINDGVVTCGIKKMTLDEATDITTIELYAKTDFAAGEPCIMIIGDPTLEESEDMALVLPIPYTIAASPATVNGLVGLWADKQAPTGAAWFDGKKIQNGEVTVTAHTGYIDATKYTGEVEGVETYKTLTIAGLNWPKAASGDVNGDGLIDSADAVAIYDYVNQGADSGYTLEVADLNGDGEVTSADVVRVYEIIEGAAAGGSPRYVPMTPAK